MESNEPRLPSEKPEEPVSPREAEPQPPEELDELQTRVQGYSEQTWTRIQRVCDGVLGLACGALLTYFSKFESIGMLSTIAAVLIALLLPNLIEKRVKRKVFKGRTALMVGLAVWLVGFTLIMALQGAPLFQPK